MNYIVVFQGFFGKKLFIMYEIYFKRVAWSWPYTNYINLFFSQEKFCKTIWENSNSKAKFLALVKIIVYYKKILNKLWCDSLIQI